MQELFGNYLRKLQTSANLRIQTTYLWGKRKYCYTKVIKLIIILEKNCYTKLS